MDANQAQVILVDPNSTEGKHYIRDWGKDENKVVLDYSWVKSSVAAGRVLNEDNNWGGFMTTDDGLDIVKQDIEDSNRSV